MPQTRTPLRYPGGKTSMRDMVAKIIMGNNLTHGHYAEPYAGGCGLALALFFEDYVETLHLNDLDRSIWSFWHCVLNYTQELVDKIKKTPVTINEWYKQRAIQENKENHDDFELGFSTFFLNRTNRSGIILKAGVIGGINQNGNYKIDCRYNKETSIRKIERIAKYKSRINLYNMDAVEFIKSTRKELPKKTLYCIDPPYFNKGSTLYTNFYEPGDHAQVAKLLKRMAKPWILTYDNAPEISALYEGRQQYTFDLNYSAQTKRKGTELFIASDKLVISRQIGLRPVA